MKIQRESEQTCILSPQAVSSMLEQLGYGSWTRVPVGQSHFLDALVVIAQSPHSFDLRQVTIELQKMKLRG